MRALIWRVFKQAWVAQLALILVLSSAVALLAIYNAFIVREEALMGSRIKNGSTDEFYLVTEVSPSPNRTVTTQSVFASFAFAFGWFEQVADTSLGRVPIAFVDTSHGSTLHTPASGSAAIHVSLAERFSLEVGDTITLHRSGAPLQVAVSEIFADALQSGIDIGATFIVNTGEPSLHNQYFVYQRFPHNQTTEQHLLTTMQNFHSRGSVARRLDDGAGLGSLIVKSNYGVLAQARFSLLVFLTLAFLTAKLLTYMDTRKILAILKTIGLRQNQVAGTVAAESLISPLCGAVLGGALSVVLLLTARNAGQDINVSGPVIFGAMFAVVPALLLGVLVPARLGQVSTVNELLYERPAALFRDKVDNLRGHYPALDAYAQQGIRFIRLAVVEGVFEGLLFRRLGDKVQAGEVIALEQSWWGMKTREYVSPMDGVIVFFEPTSGMVGVGTEGTPLLINMNGQALQPLSVPQPTDNSNA